MPAPLIPPASSRRAALRRQLTHTLRTDSELEAFCLDHFPDTYRVFTAGMDRQQKLNLLLQREDLPSIATLLGSAISRGPLRAAWSCCPTAPTRPLGWLGLSVLVLALAAALILLRTPSGEQRVVPPVVPAPVLGSTPPGAEIWDLRTGRALGITPLFIDPGVLPLTVCLRRRGFHDEVISLAHAQSLPTGVALRPVGSSLIEVCDVPIPILP